MSAEWTDKQLDAINADGSAVLVSAAAGSGKTSVLVERIIRKLSDTSKRIPADRMIIVTFTNDAAAQMKQRLDQALQKAVESDPDNSWLCRQQALLQSAKISTISSFCFDLIRENIESLDISQGFRILDETENDILLSAAVSNTFEKLYDENSDIMDLLCDFFSRDKRDDLLLEANIRELHKRLTAIPFYEDWLFAQLEKVKKGFDSSDFFASIYIDEISSVLSKCQKASDFACTLCEEIYSARDGYNEKAYNALKLENQAIKTAFENISNDDLSLNERINFNISFGRLDFARPKKDMPIDDYETEIREHIKSLRNNYKKACTDALSSLFSIDDINNDYLVTAEILSAVITVIKALDKEVSKLKAQKNALCFSDAEQLAIRLLAQNDENGSLSRTSLAKELSEYYEIIMIDEFQDSNNTQDMIFKLLSRNGTPYTMGDNLFVVGDVKQSIYRFRLANPDIFIKALDNSEIYPKAKNGNSAKVLLNKNFRSSSSVVDFCNYLFEKLMTKKVGDIDYDDDEKLIMGAAYPEKDDNGIIIDRTTEILLINPSSNPNKENNTIFHNPVDDFGKAEFDEFDKFDEIEEIVTESNLAEARAVAKKIYSMLGSSLVYENKTLRKSECRDFCILMRGKAYAQLFADMLAEYGIKASTNTPAGYLKSREITILVSLLNIIDNPMQDIPLCTVLMSPMFMLDANEISRLRLLSENPKEALYLALKKAVGFGGEEPLLDDTDALFIKLLAFTKVYDDLRYHAASQSLERLIRSIYDSTDFLSSVQVFKDGKQKRANLHLMLQYAQSYEENSAGGLSGFLRYLYNISEQGRDFSLASTASSSENIVSIRTIHSSKGLEFPYVFLCGTSKRINFRNTMSGALESSFYFNSKHGIGFRIQNREKLQSYNSFQYEMLKKIYERELLSEELRLLYVALTRAKEQLFISIVEDKNLLRSIEAITENISFNSFNSSDENNDLSSSANSMLDWLVSVLAVHPEFNSCLSLDNIYCTESYPPLKITKVDCAVMPPVTALSEIAEADTVQTQLLLNRFDFKYDNTLADTAAKLTITEIAKKESEGEMLLRSPDFTSAENGLSGAEKGTAMHTFMQYADFSLAQTDVKSEALRLAENGILSDIQCHSLSIYRLKQFFLSELYNRIKNSREIYRERKFLVKISELSLDDELGSEYNNTDGMLQGIADCLFREDDGFVLVDYKTDKAFEPSLLVTKYERQLKLYSIALEKIYGVKVKEAYIYSFSLDTHIQVDL